MDPEQLREQAKRADADELTARLATAPGEYLQGALENPALSTQHVVLLLRNRGADEVVLKRIAGEGKWTKSYQVKSGLVMHPKTPNPTSLHLVRYLYWKDLASVAKDPFLFPPLKRTAEKILSEKLGEMALGEKITLARTCGRGLVPRFLEESQLKVLEALLWNNKVTSSDVLASINKINSRQQVLEAIGHHPRWNTRRDIRIALLRNPRTPLSVSLGFLAGMGQAELKSLADLPDTSRALKMACLRLLRGRR